MPVIFLSYKMTCFSMHRDWCLISPFSSVSLCSNTIIHTEEVHTLFCIDGVRLYNEKKYYHGSMYVITLRLHGSLLGTFQGLLSWGVRVGWSTQSDLTCVFDRTICIDHPSIKFMIFFQSFVNHEYIFFSRSCIYTAFWFFFLGLGPVG